MESPALEIVSRLAAFRKEGFYITDPLREEEVLILFFKKERNPSFFNQRKRGGDLDMLDHFLTKVMESGGFVN